MKQKQIFRNFSNHQKLCNILLLNMGIIPLGTMVCTTIYTQLIVIHHSGTGKPVQNLFSVTTIPYDVQCVFGFYTNAVTS